MERKAPPIRICPLGCKVTKYTAEALLSRGLKVGSSGHHVCEQTVCTIASQETAKAQLNKNDLLIKPSPNQNANVPE